MRLLAQRRLGGAGATARRGTPTRGSFREITRGFAPRRFRRASFFGWGEFHAGASGLGKTNGDRLLGVTCAMFSFADMVHLFPDKFPGLRRGRLSFRGIAMRAFDRGSFWHD